MKVQFTPEPLLDCQKLSYMGLEQCDEPDIIFHWNYTGTIWKPLEEKKVHVINKDCLQTAKSYVDKVFTDVYGYSSRAIEPLAVEKPDNTNGCKDCRLTCDRIHGNFYQMPFLNVSLEENKIVEWRITVMDFKPVIVLLKYKTVTRDNIVGVVDRYEFTDDADYLVEDFCRAYPLEYGELDGIYFENKFYIYDVNPTPGDAAFVRMTAAMSMLYQSLYKHHLYQWLDRLSSL